MINELKNHTETKYVVCHNNVDVYHYCVVEVGQELTSGQPCMDIFNNKEDAINFMPEQYRPIEV